MRVLLFTSLKGGVGKTTAASSLAFALSFFQKKVLCVDLDFGVRGLDLALGAENSCSADVLEVIGNEEPVCTQAFPLSEFLYFLPAPALYNTREESRLDSSILSRFLARCKAEFEFVLLDLPAGGGEWFLPLSNSPEVDEAIVVSTAETVALRAAEQTAFEIRCASSAEVRLIINRLPQKTADLPCSLFEMALSAAIPVLGVVPEDLLAKRSMSGGIPLTSLPASPAARAYWNIASRLCGVETPLLKGVFPKRKKRRFLKHF